MTKYRIISHRPDWHDNNTHFVIQYRTWCGWEHLEDAGGAVFTFRSIKEAETYLFNTRSPDSKKVVKELEI